eukprot:3105120-Rhodomonas_salina.1
MSSLVLSQQPPLSQSPLSRFRAHLTAQHTLTHTHPQPPTSQHRAGQDRTKTNKTESQRGEQ